MRVNFSQYVVHKAIFIYYPMTEDSSSQVPSASKSASVLERRSPPYVLVYPVKILHINSIFELYNGNFVKSINDTFQ